MGLQPRREVTKPTHSRRVLERLTVDGDSPVGKMGGSSWAAHPSTTGHVESCGNLGGPSPKAKYSHATDSELVP